ncbi:hypothetical protein [Methylotenera sp.]|uniref:hypothetical protein n=1 Tax=Methylotenera sp. TaxID=2051956 RepID=UPI0027344137|nr:hypothetical protein [Methylotenera sp.]MDP3776799.1 hypothetical protein [Methylotenera sp.]
MANMDHIIEPDRQGIWIAATFIVALLALVVAIVGVSRNNDLMYMTQTELLLINDKIEALQTVAPPPAAPAATAE